MYACETWGKLTFTEVENLEITQRYFARFILGFDKLSPRDSCISNIGLWTIEGLIDKYKLLFFGRLCRAKHNSTHKQLFNFRLSQILTGDFDETSVTYDFVRTLIKYDMMPFLENFLEDAYIPDKRLWSKVTNQSIEISEENKWKASVERRPELNRFYKIHNSLTEHRLLRLASKNPQLNSKLLVMVKMGAMAVKEGQCSLCNRYDVDIVKHLILSCEKLLEMRNRMFYSIVDLLPVQESVRLFLQDDDDVLVTLLGGITEYTETLESEMWEKLMYCSADQIFIMYINFKEVLFEHRYNFGH